MNAQTQCTSVVNNKEIFNCAYNSVLLCLFLCITFLTKERERGWLRDWKSK